MTTDEIKRLVPMTEILARYNLKPNRAGMVSCPFHGTDRTPSMKVYAYHVYCYGCRKRWDQIAFVMEYEGKTFPEAFRDLGGTYDQTPAEVSKAVKTAQFRREVEDLVQEADKAEYDDVAQMLTWLRELSDADEPYSTAWCAIQECIMKLRMITDERAEREKRESASKAS